MRRLLAPLVAILVITALPAQAQRQDASSIGRTVTLDVIGPRTTAQVRSWLARSLRSLGACRGDEEALVVLAAAIGPDGSLISIEPRQDPAANDAATSCVITAMRGWRMPGRARSVTTVSWALRLAPRPPPPSVQCYCFDWVHLDDFGNSCSSTRAGCEAEAEASMRDHTECRSAMLPRCSDEAIIDGHRMERP